MSEMKVLASCSGLSKTLGYDAELAFASMALGYDADAREVRLQIGPLSEEECQQEKAGALCRARSLELLFSLTRSRSSSSTTVETRLSSTKLTFCTSPAAT